jgi:hypothetical protein
LWSDVSFLRVLWLERSWWIQMPLIISILPSLHLLRVVLVRLKLNMLLLFE